MGATYASQYPTAKAIESAGVSPCAHPVCFRSGAFSLGKLRHVAQPAETVIRFRLHNGHMIDVAMSRDLAAKLASALGEGGAQ